MFSIREASLEVPSCFLLTNLPRLIRKNGNIRITMLIHTFLLDFLVSLTWIPRNEVFDAICIAKGSCDCNFFKEIWLQFTETLEIYCPMVIQGTNTTQLHILKGSEIWSKEATDLEWIGHKLSPLLNDRLNHHIPLLAHQLTMLESLKLKYLFMYLSAIGTRCSVHTRNGTSLQCRCRHVRPPWV